MVGRPARRGPARPALRAPRVRDPHASLRQRERPAGTRALHGDRRLGAAAQDQAPRDRRRDVGRVRRVDDVARVGHVHDPEREPQRDVRPHVGADGAGGPLRREDQVHAERPALRGHAQQPGHDVRQVVGERAELVHHDHEAREPSAREVVDGRDARRGQEALAPVQLGPEPGERAPREPGVEVGHLAHDVGQPTARPEARSALEVDERERQLVGRAPEREPGDERLQELRLPGARRAGDEHVRPVADEVDGDGRTPEPTPSTVRSPCPSRCDASCQRSAAHVGSRSGARGAPSRGPSATADGSDRAVGSPGSGSPAPSPAPPPSRPRCSAAASRRARPSAHRAVTPTCSRGVGAPSGPATTATAPDTSTSVRHHAGTCARSARTSSTSVPPRRTAPTPARARPPARGRRRRRGPAGPRRPGRRASGRHGPAAASGTTTTRAGPGRRAAPSAPPRREDLREDGAGPGERGIARPDDGHAAVRQPDPRRVRRAPRRDQRPATGRAHGAARHRAGGGPAGAAPDDPACADGAPGDPAAGSAPAGASRATVAHSRTSAGRGAADPPARSRGRPRRPSTLRARAGRRASRRADGGPRRARARGPRAARRARAGRGGADAAPPRARSTRRPARARSRAASSRGAPGRRDGPEPRRVRSRGRARARAAHAARTCRRASPGRDRRASAPRATSPPAARPGPGARGGGPRRRARGACRAARAPGPDPGPAPRGAPADVEPVDARPATGAAPDGDEPPGLRAAQDRDVPGRREHVLRGRPVVAGPGSGPLRATATVVPGGAAACRSAGRRRPGRRPRPAAPCAARDGSRGRRAQAVRRRGACPRPAGRPCPGGPSRAPTPRRRAGARACRPAVHRERGAGRGAHPLIVPDGGPRPPRTTAPLWTGSVHRGACRPTAGGACRLSPRRAPRRATSAAVRPGTTEATRPATRATTSTSAMSRHGTASDTSPMTLSAVAAPAHP